MKMSNLGGNEQELLVKNVIRQFMKNQIDDQEEVNKERNNSFVFLENNTLNMLITYMLMNRDHRPSVEMNRDEVGLSQAEILEDLDQVISDSKKEFEEIITLLKEKF
jgi:hypothetical protein